MTEGSPGSGEARRHGSNMAEQIHHTDHTQTVDEEKPDQPRQRVGIPPTEPGSAQPPTGVRAVLKRPLLLIVAAVLGSVVVLTGGRYYRYYVTHEWTDDAFIEGHIIQISPKVAGHILQVYVTDNQEVQQGDVLLEIDPHDYAARLAQARAILQAVVAKQEAAQNSVALMSVTSEAAIQQATAGVELAKSVVQTARAQVVMARSRLEQARAQVDTAQANAAQAHAQVTAAEAEATRANIEVKRAQELYGSDQIVSRRELDDAIKDARVATAQLEAARKKALAADAQAAEARAAQQTATENLHYIASQVLEAQARVDEALGRLAAAQAAPHQMAVSQAQADTVSAEVAQAQAAVAQAEIDLAATKLYAPESGRVTRKVIEAGAYVQVGQTLLTIVRHDVWVVANFMETQLAHMRPGQRVEIKVDAYPEQVFQGRIESIQAGTGSRFSLLPPENATGNFVKVVQRVPVKIVFDAAPDPDYLLSPGMSVVPVVQLR